MQVRNFHDDEILPRSVGKIDCESASQCEIKKKKVLYLIEEKCSVWIQILNIKIRKKLLSGISATQLENKNETLNMNSVTHCETKAKMLSVNSASWGETESAQCESASQCESTSQCESAFQYESASKGESVSQCEDPEVCDLYLCKMSSNKPRVRSERGPS